MSTTDIAWCSENLHLLKPTLDYDNLPLFIFVNKGIEMGSHALTLDIIADTCGPEVAKIATFIVSLCTTPLSAASI